VAWVHAEAVFLAKELGGFAAWREEGNLTQKRQGKLFKEIRGSWRFYGLA
jgi:hypothetical protein